MRLNTKLLTLFACFIFLVMIVGLQAGDEQKAETTKTTTCAQKTDAEKAACAKTCTGANHAEGQAEAAGCTAHGVKSTGVSAAAEKDGEVKVQQATGEVKTAAKHECTAEQKAACAKSKNVPGCCAAKAKTTEASATKTSDAHAKAACVSKTDPKCATPDIEVKVGGEDKTDSK